jgi:hypothetical protein
MTWEGPLPVGASVHVDLTPSGCDRLDQPTLLPRAEQPSVNLDGADLLRGPAVPRRPPVTENRELFPLELLDATAL